MAGLADPGCGQLTHAQLEDRLTERCRELMRSLFQERELTLSEIVALAGALDIDPWTLIRLPAPAPTTRAPQARTP